MTLEEILNDMYALEDEMRGYERKYGVLSETFYQAYSRGEEPADEAWVRDWTAWASAYKLWLRRREQYQAVIQSQTKHCTITDIITQTARHENHSNRCVTMSAIFTRLRTNFREFCARLLSLPNAAAILPS